MWPFGKKKPLPKNVYKVTYIPCCDVTDQALVFQKSNMREAFVEAYSVLDAQVEFARIGGTMLCPHVAIDRITKVIDGTGRP